MIKRYADTSYYLSDYLCGKKPSINTNEIGYYLNSATAIMREVMNGDPAEITDEVKSCCCEIAELLNKNNSVKSGVSSESVGGWSQSYESSADVAANLENNIYSIMRKWLSSTELLYMGV